MTAPQLTVYIQGQGTVSADGYNTFGSTCDTFAQLRAFIGAPGIQVFARGAAAVNDGLGGQFYWNASGTGPDDNLNNLVPPGAAVGCWTRLTSTSSASSITTVGTVANMKALAVSVASVGQIVYLEGYYSIDDGGQGLFQITSTNPGADNGGTIIWSTTSGFYFVRQYSGPISLKWFGAKGDGITDDSVAMQAWLTAIGSGFDGFIPGVTANYKFASPLTHSGYLSISGVGRASYLNYTGSGVALTLDTPRFSRLQNFLLAGSSSAQGGLWVQEAQEGYYDTSVWIENFTGASAYARRFSACFIGQVNGGGSRECTNGVICDSTTFSAVNVVNSWKFDQHDMSGNTNIGLDFQSGFGVTVLSCDFSTTGTGIEIARGVTFPVQVRNITIQGCYFESTNCIYVGRGASSNSCAVYGTVAGNYVHGATNGIHLYNCDSFTVWAQTIVGTSTIDSGVTATCWFNESAVTDNAAAGQTSRFNQANSGMTLKTVNATGALISPVTVVASLGTPSNGSRAFVTDSNATVAAGIGNVVAGGGANHVPVYGDGSAWRIGG